MGETFEVLRARLPAAVRELSPRDKLDQLREIGRENACRSLTDETHALNFLADFNQ